MVDKFSVQDVFTPTKPARYTFVERDSINNKLVAALGTPGKQIVVYGHSGSGKTTLLVNKLDQVYEAHITTRCISGLTFDQLLLDAFDQLGNYYAAEKVSTKKRNISSALESEYLGIKAKVGLDISKEGTTKQQRVLPPQLTPQTLARFLGEAKCCWVLEDFHKIEPNEKKRLAQVMKVFMDMSDIYSDLKIIAIGAVGTARQVIEYDSEMRNRVSEIYVPLMTDSEIRLIPKKGEPFLNISIDNRVKTELVKFSNGLASVCHQLCLNMCFAADIEVTCESEEVLGKDILHKAVEQYLEDSSDTLKSAFDRAFRQTEITKYNDVRLIIEALLQVEQEGATRPHLLDKIRSRVGNYPATNLDIHLASLQNDERGKIIRYDAHSGRFSFSDPFYRAFALAMLGKERVKETEDIFVSYSFETGLVHYFDNWIVDYQVFEQSHKPMRSKEVPKMDWQSPIFTGKRKHRKQRR